METVKYAKTVWLERASKAESRLKFGSGLLYDDWLARTIDHKTETQNFGQNENKEK